MSESFIWNGIIIGGVMWLPLFLQRTHLADSWRTAALAGWMICAAMLSWLRDNKKKRKMSLITDKYAIGVKWTDVQWCRFINIEDKQDLRGLEVSYFRGQKELTRISVFERDEVDENGLMAFVERIKPGHLRRS